MASCYMRGELRRAACAALLVAYKLHGDLLCLIQSMADPGTSRESG